MGWYPFSYTLATGVFTRIIKNKHLQVFQVFRLILGCLGHQAVPVTVSKEEMQPPLDLKTITFSRRD